MNVSTHSMTADERLDETIIESFPASDPPPYWAGNPRSDPHPQYFEGGVCAMDIRTKRVSERMEPSDGYRILIDRLWPRGVSRPRAALDEWDKSLAPSQALRQWYRHEPSRFAEFRRRYIKELRTKRPQLAALRQRAREGALTLIYGARDPQHNDALVLADVLRHGLPRPTPDQIERRS